MNVLEDAAALIVAQFTDRDDNDTHSFSIDTTGTIGGVTDNGDGTFSYDPNAQFEHLAFGETAIDSFIYTVTDSFGGTSTSTIELLIQGQSDAPIVADLTASVMEFGDPIVLTPLFTDVDVNDTHTISFDGIRESAFGEIRYDSEDNTIIYTPSNFPIIGLGVGEVAIDAFEYVVTDNTGFSTSALITIEITGVNADPIILNGPVEVILNENAIEDGFGGNLVFLTSGTIDFDQDNLHIVNLVLVSGDDSGVEQNLLSDFPYLEVDTDFYDALNVGDEEIITYTYDIIDGQGGSVSQTATITILGENDAAELSGDTSGAVSTTGQPSASGVLLSMDVDNEDNVFQTSSGSTSYGAYSINASGSWTYVVNSDVTGIFIDNFEVLSEDGTSQIVTIAINRPLPITDFSDFTPTFGTMESDNINALDGDNNIVFGLEGDDTIYGGTGVDILIGGTNVSEGEGIITRTDASDNDTHETAIALNDAFRLFTDPDVEDSDICLLYTSPSPRDATLSRMPSSA